MISHNFKRCIYDSHVYFRRCNEESFVYLLLFVDDMLIAANDKEEIRRVKAELSNERFGKSKEDSRDGGSQR